MTMTMIDNQSIYCHRYLQYQRHKMQERNVLEKSTEQYASFDNIHGKEDMKP